MRSLESTCGRIIRNFAEKYQSVSFQPHITLAGTPEWPVQEIIKAVGEVVGEFQPFELNTKAVQCKSAPYQKITLGIEASPALTKLHKRMDLTFQGDYSKKAYPHISFLYSTLPCGNIDEDLGDIEKESLGQVLVHKLSLVHCKGTPAGWRTLYMWTLNR